MKNIKESKFVGKRNNGYDAISPSTTKVDSSVYNSNNLY